MIAYGISNVGYRNVLVLLVGDSENEVARWD